MTNIGRVRRKVWEKKKNNKIDGKENEIRDCTNSVRTEIERIVEYKKKQFIKIAINYNYINKSCWLIFFNNSDININWNLPFLHLCFSEVLRKDFCKIRFALRVFFFPLSQATASLQLRNFVLNKTYKISPTTRPSTLT